MKHAIPITTFFLDLGGVLLTDGWDHRARRRAATHFRLDSGEMQEVVYIENTPMFVQVAEGLGFRSILHTAYRSTRTALASFGLR